MKRSARHKISDYTPGHSFIPYARLVFTNLYTITSLVVTNRGMHKVNCDLVALT